MDVIVKSCGVLVVILLQNYVYSSILIATYKNEKHICNETEAINYIEKIPVDEPYGRDYRFKIGCRPLNVCNKTCEWSDRCTMKYYGEGVYIGGIHSFYYTPTQERYLALLCCNSSEVRYGSCESYKNYTGESYVIASDKKIFRQVRTNHRTEEKLWLNVDSCFYNSSVSKSTSTCFVPSRNDAGASLTALAGLAGLAGLATLAITGPGPCGCTSAGISCAQGCIPEPCFLCFYNPFMNSANCGYKNIDCATSG